MSKKFDVVVTQRYSDRDGNEQKRYINIGAVFETAKGMSMKLESIPMGWDGWCAFYEPKAKEGGQQTQQRAPARNAPRGDDMDESIPF